MDEKEKFKIAYARNELKEFFKGYKEYMIYTKEAANFIDPPTPGTGNLMLLAFKYGVIPYCKEYPEQNIGNVVINVLSQMVLSPELSDFYAGVKATATILQNNLEKELKVSQEDFEKLLLNVKNSIEKNKKFLQNTTNYFGYITFYEEFNRMNESIVEEDKKIL